jgi:hypothetical protein
VPTLAWRKADGMDLVRSGHQEEMPTSIPSIIRGNSPNSCDDVLASPGEYPAKVVMAVPGAITDRFVPGWCHDQDSVVEMHRAEQSRHD